MAFHIYHYNTHSEKRYFLGREHHGLYDMIAFNGNIVSHAPQGVAAFISTAAKPFYIDPQTHAFQHSTINLKRDVSNKDKGEGPIYEFKPSIKLLAEERLGGPFISVISNDKPLNPSAFMTDSGDIKLDVIEEISKNIISFQQDFLFNELDEEARDLIGDEGNLRPSFIISPYFYLSAPNFNRWLDINLAFYDKTKQQATAQPVYLALTISKDVLNRAAGRILESISGVNPDGVLLWIDEHSEEDSGIDNIKDYVNFIKGLKQHTSSIINTHGGYLSILLCHDNTGCLLNGVGHSINYGESRSVIPIGGGIPMARFYFPAVHSRLRFGDALGIIRSKKWLSSPSSYENVCKCAYCKKLITESDNVDDAFMAYGESFTVKSRRRSGSIVSLEYPTKEAKQAAACHYLYNKTHEFSQLNQLSFEQLVSDLKRNYDYFSDFTGDELIGHLYNWHLALKESF
jgi:hypothetical protein